MVCSGCVLGSGPEGLEFKPHTQAVFHLVFHLPPTSPTSPLSCDWVPGIYWVANTSSNGLGGTSGAYITCCEDRFVLLREFLARL